MSVVEQCPSCGAASVGALLCHADSAAFETMLAAVPGLLVELEVAISKQARVSAVNGKGGLARERSPLNWGAVDVRDALVAEVAIWGTDINELRRAPWSGKAVAGLGRAVKDAYRAIDRLQERTYLGTCLYEEDGATCHAELWSRPGAHQVRCGQCEMTHDVAERRQWLLERSHDVIATVKQASEYVGEFAGMAVNQKTIRTWMDRGKLPVHAGPTEERHLRLGDLLTILTEKATRSAA